MVRSIISAFLRRSNDAGGGTPPWRAKAGNHAAFVPIRTTNFSGYRRRTKNKSSPSLGVCFLLQIVATCLLGILAGSTVVVCILTNQSIHSRASRSRHLRAASTPAPHHQQTQFTQKQVTSVVDSPLYLPHWRPSPPSLFRDSPLQLPEIDFYLKPDHGELIIKELHDASIGRVIDPMDYQTAETYRELLLEIADKVYVSSHWWPSDDRDY